MALVVKDRVKETTATTGTGTLTLAGAVAGFQTFTSVLSNGDTTYYGIFESSTGEFEVGLGTFTSSGTTLARTTILESSNSGNAVNLTAGAADVFITQPAEKAVYMDASGNVGIGASTVDQKLHLEEGDTTSVFLKTQNSAGALLVGNNSAGNSFVSSQTASKSLLFETANTTRMTIDGSGNVTVTGSLTVDDITINGSTISDAGDLTIDVGGDIILDADGGDIIFADGGSYKLSIANSSGDVVFVNNTTDKDFLFKGYDGASLITALTLDMSDAGAATFNAGATFGGTVTADGLTVDTNTLHVDATNNRVGINDTSPARELEILGTANATTYLRISGTSGNVADTNYAGIEFYNTDASGKGPNVAAFIEARSRQDGYGQAGQLVFATASSGSTPEGERATQRLRIADNGDISFYEDTSTTAKFFWDASTERLGIGNSAPTTALDVTGSVTADNVYVASALLHEGDSDTFLSFGTDAAYLSAGGTDRIVVNTDGVTLNTKIDIPDDVYLGWGGGTNRPSIQGNKNNGTLEFFVGGGEKLQIDGTNSTFYTDIVAEDHDVYVGDFSGGNMGRLTFDSANGRGFTYEFDNAFVVSNAQGTTEQYLVLGDSATSSSETLLGVSIYSSGSYTPRFKVAGSGAVNIYNDLDVDGNLNAVDNIYLASGLIHEGDTDTYLGFSTNAINLYTGGTLSQFSSSGLFITDGSLAEDYDALSGTTPTCNVDNGGMFSLTMTGNTTFTFSGASSGYIQGFVLQLTGNGSTVTYPASVDWAGGTAPDAPASGETDILVFISRDGGTTWYGALAIDAAA